MGGSESKARVSQSIINNQINRSNLNNLNEIVNTMTMNIVQRSMKNCTVAAQGFQKADIKNIRCGLDCNINIFQNADILYDLSCFQTTTFKSDLVNQMATQLMSAIANTLDQTAINHLNGKVKSIAEQGWGSFPWGGSTANSEVEQYIKNNVENEVNINIQNILKIALYANLENSSIDQCISKVGLQQEIIAENVEAGRDIYLTLNQTEGIRSIVKCIQQTDFSNRAMEDIAQFLDIKINEDVKQQSLSEAAAEAESKSTVQGFFDAIGNFFKNIFGEFSGPFVTIGGGISSSYLICCCIIILIILFQLFKK